MDPNQAQGNQVGSRTPSLLTVVFLSTWLLGLLGFVYVLLFVPAIAEAASALWKLPIALPALTERLLELRRFLDCSTGKLVAGAAAAASLVPFGLGARRSAGTILYAALTAAVVVGFVALYFGVWLPAQEHAEQIHELVPPSAVGR